MKITIGVPCGDQVATEFSFSLAGIAHLFGRNNQAFTIAMPRRMQVADARNEIVAKAQANGSTHIFFLDSDMQVPGNVVYRLLSHAKPICGAYGVKRKFPIEPCGKPLDGWKDTGLIEMEAMGTAVMLVSMEVFKKLDAPYFAWGDVSEDVGFCAKARGAGLKIWCDADLSKEVGHVGSVVFSADMAAGR